MRQGWGGWISKGLQSATNAILGEDEPEPESADAGSLTVDGRVLIFERAAFGAPVCRALAQPPRPPSPRALIPIAQSLINFTCKTVLYGAEDE